MKKNRRFFLLAACLTPAFSIQAQTLLSDFSTNANFAASASLSGNGVYVISSGVANYTVPTASSNDGAYLAYTGALGSYTSDWSVRIDVSYANPASYFDSGVEQAIGVGFRVVPTGASIGFNGSGQPTFSSFGVDLNLFQNASDVYSREFRTSVFEADTDHADDTFRYEPSGVGGSGSASLQISFNATSKMLVAGYDADGATGGFSFTAMNTLPEDTVDASTWGMSPTDTFTIALVGNSLYDGGSSGFGPTISAGALTLDNLYGTGLTAVPEPSAFAAICGALTLGLATWTRQRRKAAAL